MPELRQDPATQEWVIVATERARRPEDFARPGRSQPPEERAGPCPFCPGNEHLTPPETLAYRRDGQPNGTGWWVRVVPNQFPALVPEGSQDRREEVRLFRRMDGLGQHEVVIESPDHRGTFCLFDDKQVEEILLVYRERYLELSRQRWARLIIVFRNHGVRAGTSLAHPHSQIITTSVVPNALRRRHDVAIRYFDGVGRCLGGDIVAQERSVGKRVLLETEDFVAFHPFASRVPFETWVAPLRPQASFALISMDEAKRLAVVLKTVLAKLYYGLNNPDYNFVIDTVPVGDEQKEYYLWHIRIVPRLTTPAGFEVGSGIFITTALPEDTAEFMRQVSLDGRSREVQTAGVAG
jgi:UDPglucose--hexose-1-phosphate uridylyltransferase